MMVLDFFLFKKIYDFELSRIDIVDQTVNEEVFRDKWFPQSSHVLPHTLLQICYGKKVHIPPFDRPMKLRSGRLHPMAFPVQMLPITKIVR